MRPPGLLAGAWTVARKEWRDGLRDRRTLLVVLLSSVLMGPLFLAALSWVVSDLETKSQARELLAVGWAQAPTLANHVARQGYTVRPAAVGSAASIAAGAADDTIADEPDLAQALRSRRVAQAVLLVPATFEVELAQGLTPRLTLWTASGASGFGQSADTWRALVQSFNQEQALLRLAWRGVPAATLQAVALDTQDAASPRQRHAQLLRMLPFFVLMAVLYGAMHGALDTTAGERERGSLEPLLATPAQRASLVLGKWAAVWAMAMAVALLTCLGLLPGQWLMRSPALAAAFHFGPAEALAFLALLAPLAAALAAAMMALAVRSASVREAQASASVLMLAASLLPMTVLLDAGPEAGWQGWLPVAAQVSLMQKVLEADPAIAGAAAWLRAWAPPSALALALAALCLWDLSRRMQRAVAG